MEEALFDKASGYYIKKDPIGKNADFTTAPEISQVFGELLAAYILQTSASLNGEVSLVEMGAGRGTLFYDILFTINKLAKKQSSAVLDFLTKTAFNIIEINEVLTEIQKEKLSGFKINWYQNFTEFLEKQENRKIFFLANELFDCFAIDQYIKTDIGWCERMIDKKDQKLQFVTNSFDPQIHNFVEKSIGLEKSLTAPFGAVFEHSAAAANFMAKLGTALQANGGVAIIIDYGYVSCEFANTLQAIKNHKKTNVLDNVGESDITALVDFSLLEKIAQSYKLHSSLVSQDEFLLALGIEQRKEILLTNKNQQEQNQINSAIDRLIDKDQMGELFKCLIIWK